MAGEIKFTRVGPELVGSPSSKAPFADEWKTNMHYLTGETSALRNDIWMYRFDIPRPFPSTALLDCMFNRIFAFLSTNAQNNNVSNVC